MIDCQPQCLKCEKDVSDDEYYENAGKCDTCHSRVVYKSMKVVHEDNE